MKETDAIYHLIAHAIRQSDTGSLGAAEIVKCLESEYPGIPDRVLCYARRPWFLNLGNAITTIWAIKDDECKGKLEAGLPEAIRYALQWKATTREPQKHPKFAVESQRLIRHAIKSESVSGGFTVSNAEALVQNKFAKDVFFSCLPSLSHAKAYKTVDFTNYWRIRLWCIEDIQEDVEAEMQRLEEHCLKHKRAIRRAMPCPEKLRALLRGEFKDCHGYSPEGVQGKIVWSVRTEEDERPPLERNLPRPPLNSRHLIMLAFKNSRTGYLTKLDMVRFAKRHFPVAGIDYHKRFKAFFTSLRNDPTKPKSYIHQVNWLVKEQEGGCETIKQELLIDSEAAVETETEVQNDTDEQLPEPEELPESEDVILIEDGDDEDIPRPKRVYYSDVKNNRKLIDDSWIQDGQNDTYYKHEFTIDYEELPEDELFEHRFSSSKKPRLD